MSYKAESKRSKRYECTSCDKKYNRKDSYMYHQRTCIFQITGEAVDPINKSTIKEVRRTNMRYMSKAFDGVIENYEIDLQKENQDDILSTLKNNIVGSYDNIIDQLEKKKSIKLQVSLYAVFHQSYDESFKTIPPIVLNSDMTTIMSSCLLEDQLLMIYNNFVSKIEDFQEQGSSWILNKSIKLDFNFYEYPPLGS